jgi:plasmid maintenance system antidote protein VapI
MRNNNMALKSFKKLLTEAKQRDRYWVEKAKLNFSIELTNFFKKSGITQTSLAEKLNTSPAYITKVFRGDANFTIETMVKLARSVDGELQIHISPKQSNEQWFDVLKSQQLPNKDTTSEWVKQKRKTDERISTTA